MRNASYERNFDFNQILNKVAFTSKLQYKVAAYENMVATSCNNI